jgi:uncharacterized protein (UPF0332 family)
MLDTKRIKEADSSVRSYLSEGLLKKTEFNSNIIRILTNNGKESLKVAESIFNDNLSDLWVIVCSYYAMYYYANAVLMKLGYKVGEKIVHQVTADALITFVRAKLKENILEEYEATKEEALNLAGVRADSLIESFDYEKSKRAVIQYKTIDIEKHSKARTSLQRAKEFTKEMEKLLL